MIDKYISKLDKEIMELIESECQNMTYAGENLLHVLMENKKCVEGMKDLPAMKQAAVADDKKPSFLK